MVQLAHEGTGQSQPSAFDMFDLLAEELPLKNGEFHVTLHAEVIRKLLINWTILINVDGEVDSPGPGVLSVDPAAAQDVVDFLNAKLLSIILARIGGFGHVRAVVDDGVVTDLYWTLHEKRSTNN